MAGPIAATGAQSSPTRYGALGMGGEQFTGLWTQAGPYRDAATPYLVRKFYQGSRFDRMIDGLNREISARMTDIRRPGSAVFNSSTFGAVNRYFAWKYVQNSAETIRLILDSADGNVYDFTPSSVGGSGQTSIFTKNVAAGKATFCGVGTQLFYGDGISNLKWTTGKQTWKASTNYLPGALIPVGTAENANLFMALGGITMSVIASACSGTVFTLWLDLATTPEQLPNLQGATIAFSGLTAAAALNGHSYAVTVVSTTLGIIQVTQTASAYSATADAGSGTTGNGTSGTSAPTFNTTQFAVTADAGQQWKCYGPMKQNFGLASPAKTPTVAAVSASAARFWLPNTTLPAGYAILDSNGSVEIASAGATGLRYPNWTSQAKGTSFAVVSATQNANLAASRSLYDTANPDTTPPVSPSVFQNTSGVALLVTVSADLGGGGFHGVVYCDSSATPTTAVAQFSRVNSGSSAPNYYPGSVTFLVPPGFYYGISVTNGAGSPFIRTWTEWELNGASSGGSGSTGSGSTGSAVTTLDGGVTWKNYGPPGSWQAITAFDGPWDPIAPVGVITDSNGNWQYVSAGGGGASGSTAPTWATTIGATTTDGALTWTCAGPAYLLSTDSFSYGFSTHAIDGSVSNSSPAFTIYGPVVGAQLNQFSIAQILTLTGAFTADAQCDQIWVWRTAQGQATLILEDQIPIDTYYAGGSFTYSELGIQDTSSYGNGALNALIAAPVAEQADPPPAGLIGCVYHLQRLWGFVGNVLYYSGGPDTVTGNGKTAWPPLNSFVYQAGIVKVLPITVQNGGLLVFTTSGIQIVLGTGTATNPFYSTQWTDKVNLGGFDALDVLGTLIFLMESNGKVSSLTIEYPFSPQSGYTEVGYPIGDQFLEVTTGGIASALYNPATSYLSWCVANTKDTGMYVADGAAGWFRMSVVSPPESGMLWSPRAAIAGGTSAVQTVEISPGVFRLLIGPPAGTPGPILMRDVSGSVWADDGTPFPSWDVKGVNLLCSTGQWTEVAHISAKSAAVGARPAISVLLNEIAATSDRPWNLLAIPDNDPALTPPSQSVYSNRYRLAQNGVEDTGDCIMTKFDYGSQAVADELYDWGIFASMEEERKEEVARAV